MIGIITYDSAEMTEEVYIKMFGFVKSIGIAGLSGRFGECSLTIL